MHVTLDEILDLVFFIIWAIPDGGPFYYITQVSINAVVTQTYRSKIERKTQYPFKITCLLEKEVNGISTNNSFQVVEELVDAAGVAKAENNFTFEASIRFYSNSSYNLELTQPIVTPKNDEKVRLDGSFICKFRW